MKKIELSEETFEIISFVIKLIIVILIIGAGVHIVGNFFESLEKTKTYTCDIESVVNSKGLNGEFILGTGNLDDESYFLAYEIQDDGGKKLKKYDSSKVTIYDTLENNEEPYVEKVEYELSGDLKACKLYVPKDTIKKEVNINLSNVK